MMQLVKEKENSELKHVKLRSKIDLVSYPARAEGLGKYDYDHQIGIDIWSCYCFQMIIVSDFKP